MAEGRESIEFAELVLMALQGDIQADQMQRLEERMKSRPSCVRAYVELMELCTELSSLGSVEIPPALSDSADRQDVLLSLLAEEEKTAPAVEIPKKETLPQPVQPKLEKKKKTTSGKLPFLWLTLNAAAIVLVIVLLKLFSQRPLVADVATLVDQLDTQWAQAGPNRENGSRLWTDEGPLVLQQGMVKIRYDTGVNLLIEGPACFAVQQAGVFLEYGRLYTSVSPAGKGFRVETPRSQFLDYGTEFGILAQKDGDAEVHVMEGRVELFTGTRGHFISRRQISEQSAVRYNPQTDRIQVIPIQKEAFVRSIHSASHMVWRGRMSLSLADIVGGGSGFEGGVLNAGFNAVTGKKQTRLSSCYPFEGPAGFRKVSEHPFIDGVFIPAAGGQKTRIASDETVAASFPGAAQRLWGYILNGAFHQGTPYDRTPLKLDGQVYGTPELPAITIHSNQGITFDLAEIRKALPGLSLEAFRTAVGLSQTVTEALQNRTTTEAADHFTADHAEADFWVLLDGQTVSHRHLSSRDPAEHLTIPIPEASRFLTLAVTESEDGISYDWALFGQPELTLKPERE